MIDRFRAAHLDLARRILAMAREQGLAAGAHLPEQQVARRCNVSRTPVRAALRLLVDQGFATHRSDEGFRLSVDPAGAAAPPPLPHTPEEGLADAVMRDRLARRLGEAVTAAEICRRYGQPRDMVQKALLVLSERQLLDRAPGGHAWVFRPTLDGAGALAESYEFRLATEPLVIAGPGFRFDAAGASALRAGMEAQLAAADGVFDVSEFGRLDLGFHMLVAQGAGNRFLADAVQAHLKLRRSASLLNGIPVFRLKASTREHLAILDQLERRQHELAADLMRVHLRMSRSLRPQAANRGAPLLPRAAAGSAA